MRVIARPAWRNRGQNPYNALLYDALQSQGVEVMEYFGGRWLCGRQDVLHVHWPESVFNHALLGAWLNSQTLLRAMDLLRARGTRCVWTAHNLAAHERLHPKAEAALWREFLARLDGYIALSQSGMLAARERFPELRSLPGFVVAHPHFRGLYPDTLSRAAAREQLRIPSEAAVLCYMGRILSYKNVPELVRVFSGFANEESSPAQLLVAGAPRTRALEVEIMDARAGEPRVRTWFRHIANDELQLFLRAADLVVLPYREIFNSGSALLALSFDRPVLMPECDATRDLRESCGADWVHGYDTLSAACLRETLSRCRTLPERSDGRWLAARDPQRLAAQTLEVYKQLVQRTAQPSASEPTRSPVP